MSELFERVLHHLEGSECRSQEWHTADGIRAVEASSTGPERWIERVTERGVMTALDCVSIIFFALDDWSDSPSSEQECGLAEGWAAELRNAAAAGEIQARDPFTLLALHNVPEGWDWGLSIVDADRFVAARGMAWKCSEIATHLYSECKAGIDRLRFPFETLAPNPEPARQQNTATPARMVAESANNTRPQNELDCVPYCTAAWQIGEQEGGWSREQLHAFIDSLAVAIRQDVLRVRDKYGNKIPHPGTVHHINWHLCPADFNKWQREREDERHRWVVQAAPHLPTASNAPEPIGSVRGIQHPPSRSAQLAEWQVWKNIPSCALWEAVCLTYDIEPDDERHDMALWLQSKRGAPYGFPADFAERLRVAQANVSTKGPIEPLELYTGVREDARAKVRLSDVAKFALDCGWQIPGAMRALVDPMALAAKAEHDRKKSKELDAMRVPGDSGTSTGQQLLSDDKPPGRQAAPVVAESVSRVIHSTKERRDTLTPVIEFAQKQCRNPQDTAEVWGALLVLAERKHPPLIGTTEDGLQYLNKGSADIFKRKSLGQRLAR